MCLTTVDLRREKLFVGHISSYSDPENRQTNEPTTKHLKPLGCSTHQGLIDLARTPLGKKV